MYNSITYVLFQEGVRKKRMEMMERERKQREQVSLWTSVHLKLIWVIDAIWVMRLLGWKPFKCLLKAFLLSQWASVIVFLSVDVVDEGCSDEEIWKRKGKLINAHKLLFISIYAGEKFVYGSRATQRPCLQHNKVLSTWMGKCTYL